LFRQHSLDQSDRQGHLLPYYRCLAEAGTAEVASVIKLSSSSARKPALLGAQTLILTRLLTFLSSRKIEQWPVS
jgi:hypothetical protein